MKQKTAELTGSALDWAVAKCEGVDVKLAGGFVCRVKVGLTAGALRYSVNWSQGGPIIEGEKIVVRPSSRYVEGWESCMATGPLCIGPTPLIAAMRCYVASKLGGEVDIPEELK